MIGTEGIKVREFPNCWEYMKCGREPGGKMAAKAGVCPATKEKRLNGVHCGKNAGRACWAVAGTFAKGNIVGSFAGRHKSCISCEFYQMVKVEEGKYFWPVPLMHKIMR